MTEPIPHVLRVEGVNFTATLLDTNDISTIRGAGLALLETDHVVARAFQSLGLPAPKTVFAGASQYAAAFTATPADAARIRDQVAATLTQPGPGSAARGQEPFNHLSYVVDVVPGNDAGALAMAEARNRARQFRQWTLVPPARNDAAAGFDPLDRARPGTQRLLLPGGQAVMASDSVHDRREYGRRARQALYEQQLPDAEPNPVEGLWFTDSFRDLVASPPNDLPLSLRNAIALVYADGNGFGGIRERVTAPVFSRKLAVLRQKMLQQILHWLNAGRGRADGAFATNDTNRSLRFETLLYGGDEFIFVMPAWLALSFVQGFQALTRDWTMQGDDPADRTVHALTHAVGVVICHEKTPIRLTRAVAHDIADAIKNAARDTGTPLGNTVGIEVFEGLMPPLDSLRDFRRRMYGPERFGEAETLRLALSPAELDRLCALAGELKRREVLPKSQAHRILREASTVQGGLRGAAADGIVAEELRVYARRRGLDTVPHIALGDRGAALDLALLVRLWDYADPFAGREPLPAFPLGDVA